MSKGHALNHNKWGTNGHLSGKRAELSQPSKLQMLCSFPGLCVHNLTVMLLHPIDGASTVRHLRCLSVHNNDESAQHPIPGSYGA
jgi:hypothetical protein